MKMQSLIAAVVLGGVLAAPAFAQTAAPAAPATNSQQNKMKTCNTQAADKKGDDRKAFMKQCLSAAGAPAPTMTQQERMKSCNTQATGKKGDDRKAFMKQCLSTKS
ncbi:PsiF family protein [Paraburkholderia acidisoli]|uniref:Phosphate starvation-inducible protein PsiF n=1 Tax=Paraburkholderia acidisoli TaxID=2571748 RepID=A0A7Z2GGP5_9BURK|nr:PsiF family protein [Paraburkholderia acidisoli]QGZ61482.1 phosphate starvation-inducible protein PsiF [Paraburkholderia acidisoli]